MAMAPRPSHERRCLARAPRWLPRSPPGFDLPAYVGSRGWIALRLDAGEIEWGEVTELVCGSYMPIVPKATRRKNLSRRSPGVLGAIGLQT
jgi:hypothetical protein